MDRQGKLHEKLRKLEALFQRAGSPGERAAAEAALGRLNARLGKDHKRESNSRTESGRHRPGATYQARPPPPTQEVRFTFPDLSSTRLFKAICSKYGIKTYRYRGQRHTTVMARVVEAEFDRDIWPEYEMLYSQLQEYIEDVTDEMIDRIKGSGR